MALDNTGCRPYSNGYCISLGSAAKYCISLGSAAKWLSSHPLFGSRWIAECLQGVHLNVLPSRWCLDDAAQSGDVNSDDGDRLENSSVFPSEHVRLQTRSGR